MHALAVKIPTNKRHDMTTRPSRVSITTVYVSLCNGLLSRALKQEVPFLTTFNQFNTILFVQEVAHDRSTISVARVSLRPRSKSTMAVLLSRPDDAGAFQETSAGKVSALCFTMLECPNAFARFGEMLVLHSSMYSSSPGTPGVFMTRGHGSICPGRVKLLLILSVQARLSVSSGWQCWQGSFFRRPANELSTLNDGKCLLQCFCAERVKHVLRSIKASDTSYAIPSFHGTTLGETGPTR